MIIKVGFEVNISTIKYYIQSERMRDTSFWQKWARDPWPRKKVEGFAWCLNVWTKTILQQYPLLMLPKNKLESLDLDE